MFSSNMLSGWEHWEGGILINYQEGVTQKDLFPGLMRKGKRKRSLVSESMMNRIFFIIILTKAFTEMSGFHNITNFTSGIVPMVQDLLFRVMFMYKHLYSLFFLLGKFEATRSYLVSHSVSCFWTSVISYVLISQLETWREFSRSAYRRFTKYIGTILSEF